MSVDIGARIRSLRTARGLSQEEVARRTGIGLKSYGDLERGRTRDPHYSTLRGVARALGVRVEELLEEPIPLGEAPATPNEWARELGARLHGMSGEEWDAYIHSLESVPEIEQVFRELSSESVMLHAALRADKWIRPENRLLRAELMPGIRELRARRYGDLAVEAQLREAGELAQSLWKTLQEETVRRGNGRQLP
jgi:transcriptional regulator with XRE-family HTH domain